jgi:hypothetical protein
LIQRRSIEAATDSSTRRRLDNNTVNPPGNSSTEAMVTADASSTATRRLCSTPCLPAGSLYPSASSDSGSACSTLDHDYHRTHFAHATRPIQTSQPLHLRSVTSSYCSRLSAHKQSSSQIISGKKVRSSDAYVSERPWVTPSLNLRVLTPTLNGVRLVPGSSRLT